MSALKSKKRALNISLKVLGEEEYKAKTLYTLLGWQYQIYFCK